MNPWLRHGGDLSKPTVLLIHATGGRSLGGAIETLRKRGLSYHYLIDFDGGITKCVPVSKIAFHAGVSYGPQGFGVNRYSIGASLVGDRCDRFTRAQYEALVALADHLSRVEAGLRFVTGHKDVSPGRKSDPYCDLPMELVAKETRLEKWR